MAVIKLKNGKYQAKLLGADGNVLSRVFTTKREAQEQDQKWKLQKRKGDLAPVWASKITVGEFFHEWWSAVQYQASPGWRECQLQFFEKYIRPVIGDMKLSMVTPQAVSLVMGKIVAAKKSEQTQLHVYNLLKKMYRDAEELFQLETRSPVLRTLRPKVPRKEAKYLSVDQLKTLLEYVIGKDYDLAIWTQALLGLRVSELIALKWSDVDLDRGIVLICSSYSRKDSWATGTKTFRDRPKGRRHHWNQIPSELLGMLSKRRAISASPFVAESPNGGMLSYEFYLETLKRYCKEAGIPLIGTHGLRHSASELYLHHGASEDDIRRLFAHSSSDITERYLHSRGKNLERVANVIRLFPAEIVQKSSKTEGEIVGPKQGGVITIENPN